ncbi:MAG: hypothetical protein M1840_001130 [Geoglossum simile]|nr:MAG: hypothetical protein M1840_001130 [Geoglossum simile]
MLDGMIKRGLVHISQTPTEIYLTQALHGNDSSPSMKEWAAKALLVGTVVVFVISWSLVSYVYGQVIATLAAVEDPSATAYIIDAGSDNPKEPLLEKTGVDHRAEPELHLVRNRPITSSFRTTLHYLRAQDGWTGPFRGAAVHFVYCVVVAFVIGLLSWLPSPFTIIAVLLCARLDLAWNNIVISKDSPKCWYRRMPTLKSWLKVLPATAVYAVADKLAIALPAQLARMNGLQRLTDNIGKIPADGEQIRAVMHTICRSGFAVFLVSVAINVLILIPARVTLTRVQASLLPEDEEVIVPFDRSFGGKVVPESLGGHGVVGILDAWKSFGYSSRIRLLKVYVKVWAIQIALFTLFGIALLAEVAYFVPELGTILVRTTSSPTHQVSP